MRRIVLDTDEAFATCLACNLVLEPHSAIVIVAFGRMSLARPRLNIFHQTCYKRREYATGEISFQSS